MALGGWYVIVWVLRGGQEKNLLHNLDKNRWLCKVFLGAPIDTPKLETIYFLKAYQFIWPFSFPKPFFFLLCDYFKAVYDIFKI